jgi:hypothetical protein
LNTEPIAHEKHRSKLAIKPILGFLTLLLAAIALCAQDNGVSAGGKWMQSSSEDKMTAAKRVKFWLPADNFLDGDYKPAVSIFCTDGKWTLSDFRPNGDLGRPNRPGFWGQPQMEVTVRVDNSHSNHGWNWVNGDFLAMDKGTTRQLIGATIFKIEFLSPRGPRIAEFSPAGLNLEQVRLACGLKPEKP